MQTVTYAAAPFGADVRRLALPPGLTIAEMVARAPGLPRDFAATGTVCVDGVPVPRAHWSRVRVRATQPRAPIVTLHRPLHGGGRGGGGDGGGKNVGATVAMIALVVVAAMVTAGQAGFILGPAFAAGTIGAQLAGTAILVAGSLAIAALTPPPSLDTSALTAGGGIDTIAAQGRASLSGNALAPGGALPRVVGTHRVYPPLVVHPLIDLVGDDEIVEAVYALAGPHALEDARLGAVSIADVPDVEIEFREGWANDPALDLVRRMSRTDQVQLEMSQHRMQEVSPGTYLLTQGAPDEDLPKWHRVRIIPRSALTPDEVWITLAWPSGLFAEASPSEILHHPLRLRLRAVGTETWTNLPEIHVAARKMTPFQKMVRLKWGTAPASVPVPQTAAAPVYAYKSVPAQTVHGATRGGWTADAHFSAGAGNDLLSAATAATTNVRNVELTLDSAVFWLDPLTHPPGRYEIEVMAGYPYRASVYTPAAYDYGGYVLSFFDHISPAGAPHQTGVSMLDVHRDVTIARVAAIYNTDPCPVRGDALIALRGKSRQVDRLSVLASGYVRDWSGSAWDDWRVTSNPAPHYRDVLAGRLAAEPLRDALIDDDSLLAWAARCAAAGHECNAVFEGRSAAEVATVIAACGYARPRQSERWGVIEDYDRSAEAPVQLFSPVNSADLTFERAFAPKISGFRVKFRDAEIDYEDNEIIVFDPAADEQDYARLEEIRYDGIVTEGAARARARFDLTYPRHRFVFYSFTAAAEAIACTRGDLIAVQHDVIERQAGFARVQSVTIDAGLVTGLVLTGAVPGPARFFADDDFLADDGFFVAPRLGAMIRLGGGAFLTEEITVTGEESATITFATPFAPPAGLEVGCHVVTGPLGQEHRRLIVTAIQPKSSGAATITAVPEAPEIWSI